ncbi:hypothetical protein [Asticcacaulis sp. EMRT-3]|uniref:hypothetical protein n=1 Tax=Asticcacaulis sp. EMRT-3 TaxID=3040349 RepID=UPI0024AEC868|nr:hypothetical protein [Asticcacaulis sp. EMRT-3]MDI7774694.1 hypothetical protein [Asticcacaulis sp. EMRT-3]
MADNDNFYTDCSSYAPIASEGIGILSGISSGVEAGTPALEVPYIGGVAGTVVGAVTGDSTYHEVRDQMLNGGWDNVCHTLSDLNDAISDAAVQGVLAPLPDDLPPPPEAPVSSPDSVDSSGSSVFESLTEPDYSNPSFQISGFDIVSSVGFDTSIFDNSTSGYDEGASDSGSVSSN